MSEPRLERVAIKGHEGERGETRGQGRGGTLNPEICTFHFQIQTPYILECCTLFSFLWIPIKMARVCLRRVHADWGCEQNPLLVTCTWINCVKIFNPINHVTWLFLIPIFFFLMLFYLNCGPCRKLLSPTAGAKDGFPLWSVVFK